MSRTQRRHYVTKAFHYYEGNEEEGQVKIKEVTPPKRVPNFKFTTEFEEEAVSEGKSDASDEGTNVNPFCKPNPLVIVTRSNTPPSPVPSTRSGSITPPSPTSLAYFSNRVPSPIAVHVPIPLTMQPAPTPPHQLLPRETVTPSPQAPHLTLPPQAGIMSIDGGISDTSPRCPYGRDCKIVSMGDKLHAFFYNQAHPSIV